MSVIDIRKIEEEPTSKIVFYDEGVEYVTAASLTKHSDYFRIVDEDEERSLIIESKEQTEHLIKALQKAIELKWVS